MNTTELRKLAEADRIVLEAIAGRRSGMVSRTEIRDAARAVLDHIDELTKEMHARELHHFESEELLAVAEGKITRALEVVMDKRNILSPYVSRDELRRILTEGDPE